MNIPFMDLGRINLRFLEELQFKFGEIVELSAFIGGEECALFEKEFAQFCGALFCVGVGNGTDALFLALKALGLGQGHTVVTAANTFVATGESISHTGARPIFVDCHPTDYIMDVNALEKVINSNLNTIKAIVPVHLYGRLGPMDKICELAREYNLYIVEDAAQAHGAIQNGQAAGSIGQFGCFSFYPGKNLGAFGDAGALVTNDESLALKVRRLANHGRTSKYNHEVEGYNSRLDNLQAAILRIKLKALKSDNEERVRLAKLYTSLLQPLNPRVITPEPPKALEHVFHLYVVQVEDRDKLRIFLKERGIQTGVHYPISLPNLKAYSYLNHKLDDFPVASMLQKKVLSLPLFPGLKEAEVEYVTQSLFEFYG